MKNCLRAPLAALALAAASAFAVACNDTATVTSATTAVHGSAEPHSAGLRGRPRESNGGYLPADGDKDGDDPGIAPRGQDDQSLLATYGGPARARPAAARPIEALVRRYLVAAAAEDGAGACELLSADMVAGLIAEQGATSRDRRACAAAIAPTLARLRPHLLAEDPATMVVLGVYLRGAIGLAVLGFRRSPETNIVVQREGRAWKIGALFDNEMT